MSKRHPNHRRVNIRRSYTVQDVARLFGAHKNTVRAWVKAGLPTCDEKRPILILGHDLASFIQARRARNKQTCRPGEIYCVRCRCPKFSWGDMAEYRPVTEKVGNLTAICPDCNSIMNRCVSLAKLGQVRGKMDITVPQALQQIVESNQSSVNSDSDGGKWQPLHTTQNNERIKRKYLAHLKEAQRHSEPTVDAVAKALHRFEVQTKHRDFKAFHFEQAIAFKRHLAEQKAVRSGEKLSKATLHATLIQLKRFFQWLALQPAHKSRFQYSDADYFNLSDKDTRIATAQREQKAPISEQIRHVVTTMPADTEIERRNRALIAFTLLSGARDRAIASMKLKHVDLIANSVAQDAREVNTKFSKTFTTFFFPVGDEVRGIVEEWVSYLRGDKLWGDDDPLFPATHIAQGATRQFEVSGLERKHWGSTTPIRVIFREAFVSVGLPYFNPHSFRNTLVRLGQDLCKSAEQFKAWSQNLGHEQVLTTFLSYGELPYDRQGELIRALATPQQGVPSDADEIAEAVLKKFRDSGVALQVR